MSKIRVHELAKELNKSSKDVITALKLNGIYVESHMSLLSTADANKVRRHYSGEKAPSADAAKASGEKKPAPRRPAQGAARRSTGGIDSNGNYVSDSAALAMNKGAGAETRTRKQPAKKPAAAVKEETPEKVISPAPVKDEIKAAEKPAVTAAEKTAEKPAAKPAETAPAKAPEKVPAASRTETPASKTVKDQTKDTRKPSAGDSRPPRREGEYRKPRTDRPQKSNNNSGRTGSTDRPDDKYSDNRRSGQGRTENNDRQSGPGKNAFGGKYNNGNGQRGKGGFGRDTAPAPDTNKDNRGNRRKENKEKDSRKEEHSYESRGGKNDGLSKVSRNQHRKSQNQKAAAAEEKITSITLPDSITLKDFANKVKIPVTQIIKKLFLKGKIYTLNSEIGYDEAEEIALDYDILCEHEEVVDVIEEMLKEDVEDESDLVIRPPVVCVMGHVDHGKTSILDAIRNTKVTAGEAGGITQHIGAYVVDVDGRKITFLDTPGHEAFTSMRLRGAKSTDIAVLVVAADDGVMPQTVEAINHAKAAQIDIIVAINKIDKPGANVDRVKQELTEYGLVAEDWGGSTIMVPVSAHTGEGLDSLLEMILLDAEVNEFKANPNRNARGLVLEAKLDKGRGPVATVLVQKGTLNVGDNISIGTCYGKIRAMIDDTGRRVKKAAPSVPVEIQGLNEVPEVGNVFIVTDTEKEARSMAETFIATNREKMLSETRKRLSLDSLFDQIQEGQLKELNIVVKADVQGSVEAVQQSLAKLSNEEVVVKVIHGGVGAINASDVMLASASNALIIGFNVRPDAQAKALAEEENVDIRLYRVIYNAIEDIEAAMKGMLEPTFEEKILGHVDVRQTYKVSGVGTIIGGYVTDGKVERGSKVRLLRDNVVIYEGGLATLRRFKDDVKEVSSGYECGMSLEKFNDIKEGDKVEVFVMEEVKR
ncbi:MAG: translation initiation factor IF-2 [Saccharofermentans sp.]|nr:translation initiation factor IF-2 [Saccharofermentans sp.]